jgi:hypothetical protein
MFALNFLLESAMHEGVIRLKLLSFTPAFQLPISIPANPEPLYTPFSTPDPDPSKT